MTVQYNLPLTFSETVEHQNHLLYLLVVCVYSEKYITLVYIIELDLNNHHML